MKSFLLMAVAAALVVGSGSAYAEETAKPKAAKKGEETLDVTKIVGKRQRPAVAVEVARKEQKMPIAELKQPLVERIGQRLDKSPF